MKSNDYLLVDGYNIIFAWKELKKLAEDNLEAAKTRLINQLCNYQGTKKMNLILVFDAYKVEGGKGSVTREGDIYVVYTKEAETADQYIEKTTHELKKNYNVTVATSDGLEQVIIMSQGALRMSAKDLEIEVNANDKAIAEKQALVRDGERVDPLRLDPLPAPRGVLLGAADLSLYRGAQAVCGPLRFTLQAGDRLALTGPNGCGKTTLLRLVAGEDIAHTGTLERPGSLVLSVVAQHSAPHGSVEAYAAEAGVDLTRLLTLLRKFGLERVQFEAPVESWSEGQRKKLALARSLCQRAHIYLWDEPLNYIDLYARMQIEAMLRESGATLLFVEHDRAFRQAVATGEVDLARV